MPKLDKGTLAHTFKFDCDRFLRFRLATDQEKEYLKIRSLQDSRRPGIQLIREAGREWEASKYDDLLATYGEKNIIHNKNEIKDSLGIDKFNPIINLFDILRADEPPKCIIEAEFDVPITITDNLRKAYENFNLSKVKARPDILWIKPRNCNTPLIDNYNRNPKYEIHIIDVKMAAEPSLKHFTEVTYYALALSKALELEGLTEKYGVAAEGKIWPGNHDKNEFRNLVKQYSNSPEIDPVDKALNQTLVSVPYEVYESHVRHFFEHKLLSILSVGIHEASWHVNNKCQLCDYVDFCEKEAKEIDHLSRLAWLNQGQAEILRANKISTIKDLIDTFTKDNEKWKNITQNSHQLRADTPAIIARAKALKENRPILIEGRKSALMPAWSNQAIYITVHFDPGSGITFALGATRIYFKGNREKNSAPIREEKIFIVDRVNTMNPETEKARLKEFAETITYWMMEVSSFNKVCNKNEKETSHFYFWNTLEVRQLKRMFERHLHDEKISACIENLVRFFPPDNQLPDADAFKSQPGSIVKEAIRTLVGIPVAHDYSLFDVANNFFPNMMAEQKAFNYNLPFGFSTPMSDQIPFERAYELWQDNIFLKHFDPENPYDQTNWRTYSRDEIYEGIKKATKTHLKALEHIVHKLQINYRDQLKLNKKDFSVAAAAKIRVPEVARKLITFEKLNVASQEIENRNIHSLPVEEREARFISIRGLQSISNEKLSIILDNLYQEKPELKKDILYLFNFSKNSCEAKIKEGDFLLALTNEDSEFDLNEKWYHCLNINFEEGKRLLSFLGLENEKWVLSAKLEKLVQVTVVKLNTFDPNPYIILKPNNQILFNFALSKGLINFSQPLILDPIFRDFTSSKILKNFRLIGGKDKSTNKKPKKSN
ncbi:hypothetical protein [Acinetobacter radioresistens]|uniref:hypothetical protein n=1 Tax=Acinetobacter radioresistens TaxID=40216 RepID=UPI002551C261|nr:hypothetical protein [Acinetobacter radioresistens]MDK8754243.1 hypothetical protein [Acinetobacter radioresistens]